jgi:hypothetical protein
MSKNPDFSQSVARRAKQSSREIVLALLLTLAALAFVCATVIATDPKTAASLDPDADKVSKTR